MHSDICKLHQNTVKAESHSELAVTKIETCLCSTVYSFFCMGSCSLYKWWFSGQTVHSLSNCLSMVTMHPGSPRVNFRRKYVFQPLFFFMQTPPELHSVSCPVNLWKFLCLKIAVLHVTIVLLRLIIPRNVTIFQLHSSDFVNIRAMFSMWAIRNFIKTPAKLKKNMIRG